MRILVLGSSAALADPDRCQSSLLVTLESGVHYLFDVGEGATRQMVKADVNPADVGTLFLTLLIPAEAAHQNEMMPPAVTE